MNIYQFIAKKQRACDALREKLATNAQLSTHAQVALRKRIRAAEHENGELIRIAEFAAKLPKHARRGLLAATMAAGSTLATHGFTISRDLQPPKEVS